VWPGGDLQEGPNGRGLGGPGVDLQLEGLEERVCRRKQMTRNAMVTWVLVQRWQGTPVVPLSIRGQFKCPALADL
jgi:hypothetical protein